MTATEPATTIIIQVMGAVLSHGGGSGPTSPFPQRRPCLTLLIFSIPQTIQRVFKRTSPPPRSSNRAIPATMLGNRARRTRHVADRKAARSSETKGQRCTSACCSRPSAMSAHCSKASRPAAARRCRSQATPEITRALRAQRPHPVMTTLWR